MSSLRAAFFCKCCKISQCSSFFPETDFWKLHLALKMTFIVDLWLVHIAIAPLYGKNVSSHLMCNNWHIELVSNCEMHFFESCLISIVIQFKLYEMEKYHLFCQAPPIFATRSQNGIIGDLQMIIKTNFQFKCIEKSFVLMPKLSICNGLLKTLLQYFLAVRKRRIFKMRVIVTAKLHVNVLILT